VDRLVDGVHLIETPDLFPRSGYDPWDTLLRILFLRQRSFDLIHAFESRPVVLGPTLYLHKKCNVPLVMDWCDWFGAGGSVEDRQNPIIKHFLRPIETFFEESFRHYAQGTTVINTILRHKAVQLGIPENQILLLPNGANVVDIQSQNQQLARRELDLPLNAPIIAYTGAIFYGDADLMAKSFNKILAVNPNVHLLLIGYFNVDIEDMIINPEAVIRTGPVSYQQLARYLSACDLGWLPLCNSNANRGRFPMKLNDFMAAGRPVVVTDVGDLGNVVRQYQVGYVSEDQPGHLSEAVLKMLGQDKIRQEMGQQARLIAETELAWPIVTNSLEKLYLSIL
jgi:glycosyltransferase involved in cell wall biosynthesis